MHKIAAILIATTAMAVATPGFTSGNDQSHNQAEPFFWTDIDGTSGAGQASSIKDPKSSPPKNPVMRAYPEDDAPKYRVPQAGLGRYFDDDCSMDPRAPYTMQNAPYQGANNASRLPATDPALRRRGEMTGDDGVLEAIQDDPCTLIYRRGGATPRSINEYTHPDDIRRVNTLEDRRIPIHEVGRYAPEGSSLWHRDPNNPFVDAARQWRVDRGMMLSEMLTAWGDEAGFSVVWRSAHDYVVQTDVVITGTFPEAAGQVIESFSNATPPIAGDFYISNRVLVVDSGTEFDGR